MIAARRDDVADLNARARQLLQDIGRLPADELTVAGRGFSTGDLVIGTRNDRKAGLLNGQRAKVTAIEPEHGRLELRLADGQTRTVDGADLQDGHLDHGYAITAHRAQGATVERTFVLGSQELYREWGYTALSRHKHEARFYVAGSDLHLDREKPPPHDPLVAGLTQMLQRTQAKELALESLPLAQRQHLEQERQELHGRFMSQPQRAHLTGADDGGAPQVARFLAVAQELRVRDTAAHRAANHLQNLDRDPLELGRGRRAHDLNLDLDFGR